MIRRHLCRARCLRIRRWPQKAWSRWSPPCRWSLWLPAEPLLDKPEGQAGLEAGPDAEKGAADTLDPEAMDPGRIAALPVEPVLEPVPEAGPAARNP